ncbi:Gfo/Idh/MocA family protein [Paenibacillus hodogayensis]|uniref:Gfo/Idh/MocA family protein n=1 Tax=Paenibacillus hodogayensis TaxID=279208 RepID=A0ABV5VZX6_9BACL
MQHIVLIGAGTMGGAHASCYIGLPQAKLVGIVDSQLDRAERLAQFTGARAFATLEEALQSLDQVDIVDVCVPTFLHKEFVLKAAEHRKHVICEKPLAGNLPDALEMIDFCKAQEVRLFVGHVLRFFPEYEKAKSLLDSGTIGQVGVVRMTRAGRMPSGFNDWYADTAKSGGVVMDLSIHDIDFLRWCFGDVERVYAKSLHGRANQTGRTMDYGLVTLRFQNGVIAHVEGSWAHEGFTTKYEFAGSGGIIDFDSGRDKPLALTRRQAEETANGVHVPESPVAQNPYARELQHFLECLEDGSIPRVTAEDGYKAVEIVLAAIRSMETGQPVTL